MPDDMQDAAAEADAPETPQEEPESFSREYVQRIRAKAKAERLKLQEKLKQAEERAAQGAGADDVAALKTLLETERAERAERAKAAKEAADAQRDALRLKVATEAGLPAALASRLNGDDEAALRADADSLKALGIGTLTTGSQRPGSTTTAVPGGSPQGETDAQRRARLGYG